jgi:hypothetical protein
VSNYADQIRAPRGETETLFECDMLDPRCGVGKVFALRANSRAEIERLILAQLGKGWSFVGAPPEAVPVEVDSAPASITINVSGVASDEVAAQISRASDLASDDASAVGE